MIPWTLIIIGALCTVLGVIGLISLLLLPVFERFEIVYDKEKEIIQSRTDPEFAKHVWYEKKHLTRDFIVCILVGILMFFAGLYLGYAAKGEDFWPYKKLFPEAVAEQQRSQISDRLNDAGQFVADDGKAYTFYVMIDGKTINFSGVLCVDLAELEQRLSEIKRENTVIIYDDFAVSSTYRAVEELLNKMGINYEETR